jgi:hypothetical protein
MDDIHFERILHMRRAIAVGLIGFALTLMSARPASAQWGWFRWIQELSGPGPIALQGVTVTFGCAQGKIQTKEEREKSPLYGYVFCDYANNWKSIRHFYGVTAMWGDGENNLVFPADREKLERVKSSLYLAFGTLRLHPGFDVGGSLGFTRFTGTPDITATKFIINPFVVVRPVGLFLKPEKAGSVANFFGRAIEFNAGLIILPQGFHLSDFGAIGGPDWSGDPEFNGQIGLKIRIVY